MKVRHVIGIIFLIIAVLCMGPMIFVPGFQFEEIPSHQAKWWLPAAIFGVPAAVFVLIGALVTGPGHRLQSAAWALLAGAAYGGGLLLMMAPMMGAPEFAEMMSSVQADQGRRPLTASLSIERPLYLAAILAVIGAAGLYLHHVVLNPAAGGDETHGDLVANQEPGGRPLSVSILSWVLIVTSTLGMVTWIIGPENLEAGLAASTEAYGGPPPAVARAWMIGAMFVSGLSGVFLLRGANWARWLLVSVSGVGIIVSGILNQPLWGMLPGLLWLAVYVYFLFLRAPAAAFFSAKADAGGLKA